MTRGTADAGLTLARGRSLRLSSRAMDWYDWFASFHDRSLEPLYRDARAAAVTALAAEPRHGGVRRSPSPPPQLCAWRSASTLGLRFSGLSRLNERVSPS